MYRTQAVLTSKFLSNLEILKAACDKHWSNYLSQTISGEDLHQINRAVANRPIILNWQKCISKLKFIEFDLVCEMQPLKFPLLSQYCRDLHKGNILSMARLLTITLYPF